MHIPKHSAHRIVHVLSPLALALSSFLAVQTAAAETASGGARPAPAPATATATATAPATAIIAYPLTTCIVSGEPLGSMGDAVVFVHDGREIKVCCKGCVAAFRAEPARFLAALPAVAASATRAISK